MRSSVISTVGVVRYFTVPVSGHRLPSPWLLVGLALLAILIGWQTVRIARSRHPRAQAIGALTTSVPLLLMLFAGCTSR